jgi:hypothetical protein
MTLRPFVVQCPSCASDDITYTCEPKCCFNHICAACYTTFQLVTTPIGPTLKGLPEPLGERDCLAPTVACGRCESLDVYTVEGTDTAPAPLVCAACQALLQLEFEQVERR